MKTTLVSLLLISAAVCVTPASANYFSNARLGVNLNIGSAPNPKWSPRPVIAETPYITGPNTVSAIEPVPEISSVSLPPQAVVEAEPEAAPAPPPVVSKFVVFFDFDKSNLSVEARDVVAVAVRTAKATGMARVVVTGHTDTVGSKSYNQALSERRAGAVRTELVRLGMDARGIDAVGQNFSVPLVQTGPGAREPQNRRAVIDLGYNLTATLVPNSASEQ